MSGVLPTDKCKAEFAILREKRAYKFITFKIDATGTMTDVRRLPNLGAFQRRS